MSIFEMDSFNPDWIGLVLIYWWHRCRNVWRIHRVYQVDRRDHCWAHTLIYALISYLSIRTQTAYANSAGTAMLVRMFLPDVLKSLLFGIEHASHNRLPLSFWYPRFRYICLALRLLGFTHDSVLARCE